MVDDVGAQMKADGLDAEQMDERSRQHVLTRVLLHVIEPAAPVHDPMHGLSDTWHRSIDDVHNSRRSHRRSRRPLEMRSACRYRTADHLSWDKTPCDRGARRGGRCRRQRTQAVQHRRRWRRIRVYTGRRSTGALSSAGSSRPTRAGERGSLDSSKTGSS